MENKTPEMIKIQNCGGEVLHLMDQVLAPFCVLEFPKAEFMKRYDNAHVANLFKKGDLKVVEPKTPIVTINTLKEKLEADAKAKMAEGQNASLAAEVAAQTAEVQARVAAVPAGNDPGSQLAASLAVQPKQ